MQNKLYQLIINRLDGDHIHSQEYRERIFGLVNKGIGGFIIFGGEREEIKAFIEEIQSMLEIPLFIASDIERGVAQQIRGCTGFPCQMAVRAAVNKDRTEDIGILRNVIRAIALETIDVGINLPLIPVLDVNQNPDNPIVCTRAFSDNPEDVAFFGSEYIKILEGLGLTSCSKHFPGHGPTSIDSHIFLPRIDKSYMDLMNTDLLPFIGAIRAGVSSIMVGHLLVPALDSVPASLSKRIVHHLLRSELGFGGLVLTDALTMSALSGMDHIPARCLDAGVDVLLHPADADLTVHEIESAIRSGIIDERCVDAAITRILKAKQGFRHIDKAEVEYSVHNLLSRRITDMSITLVKHKHGILPVTDNKKVQVVLTGEDRFYRPSLWEVNLGIRKDAGVESPGEVAVFAIFSETSAFRGISGICEDEAKRIIGLINRARHSIVISFGSPYVLSHFKDADILIAAYDTSEQAQESVLKCLKGEMDFRGQMPVRLP